MTGPMTLVVFEHFTSIPPAGGRSPAVEGRAMRDAVVADFLALPGIEVVVPHASAWPPPPMVPRHRGRVGSNLRGVILRGDPETGLRAALRNAGAALVIAPEQDGILERLSAIVEGEGRVLLGPSARAVRLAGDKAATGACLAAAGLPAPPVEVIRFDRAGARLARRPLPFILKPRDGCGSVGVIAVRRRDRLAAALAAVRAATSREDLLVQDHLGGDPASVSIVVPDGRGDVLPLALNRQTIRGRSKFVYAGGLTPWRHHQEDRALRIAVETTAALRRATPGWRGYIGIDLVLGGDGPRILEVNPRLTTSYVGLRHVVRENLAGLIHDAALGRPLPPAVPVRGAVEFGSDGAVRRAARRPA